MAGGFWMVGPTERCGSSPAGLVPGRGGVGVDAVVLSAVGVLLDWLSGLSLRVCYRVVALRFVVGSWAVCSMTRRRPGSARAIFSDLVEAPMH